MYRLTVDSEGRATIVVNPVDTYTDLLAVVCAMRSAGVRTVRVQAGNADSQQAAGTVDRLLYECGFDVVE